VTEADADEVLTGGRGGCSGADAKEARLSEGDSLEKTRHPGTGHLDRPEPGHRSSHGMSCARSCPVWTA
jgi:hypothetical protein